MISWLILQGSGSRHMTLTCFTRLSFCALLGPHMLLHLIHPTVHRLLCTHGCSWFITNPDWLVVSNICCSCIFISRFLEVDIRKWPTAIFCWSLVSWWSKSELFTAEIRVCGVEVLIFGWGKSSCFLIFCFHLFHHFTINVPSFFHGSTEARFAAAAQQAVLREEEEMNMPTQAICFSFGGPWVSEDWFPGFPPILFEFFPTCQVRVVRFYVSCLLLLVLLLSSSPLLFSSPPAPCRTSTTTIHAQCAMPDLKNDHPRPVFPAGPQPRVSMPSVPCRTSKTTTSVPCRTSTASIHAKCSLPDLM